jgi:uncharacterized membrane protein YfcA
LLALKLLLVPSFLLLVSLAGKRWGPAVAGSLAGLPLVTGPILFFLAMEHGETFAAAAAASALSAVLGSAAFGATYANAAQRTSWLLALLVALLAWLGSILFLAWLPASFAISLAVAVVTLAAAPRMFPIRIAQVGIHAISKAELASRMIAGAGATVAVTFASSTLGHGWSGLLAVFPVLGSVLAVFSHRREGAANTAVLLYAMATGLYPFTAFCSVLVVALPRVAIAGAFALAVAGALVVQVVIQTMLMVRGTGNIALPRVVADAQQ